MSRRICHGRKNKQRHKHSHGRMSKQKNKHLPRINTELHGKDRSRNTEVRPSRSISHEKNTVFRAGYVSDGINIRFGKGPFGKLRDRGSSPVWSVGLPAVSQPNPSNWPLNKRGQVSFSALNIFYSWFRLIAEKET